MKLKKLFDLAVEAGIAADPRSEAVIRKSLKRVEERHKRLEGKEREHIDAERTWNPYLDSRILNGTGNEEIQNLMIGIDIETPEILLANELRKGGEKIDAIMFHHPEGRALADLEKVMHVQIDILARCGIPENRAEGLLRPRMDKIWRSIHSDNLFRVERAAELLKIPLFGCHTITDNLAWRYMEEEICKKKFDSLGEIMDALLEIPEYALYAKKGNPPILVNGNKEGRPGKIFANEFTGGTNGPEELMKLQADAGVGTILSMHVTEKTLDAAKEHHVNIIQCSHMASDALGINLLVDEWQRMGAKLEILPVSGFVRVERRLKSKGVRK
ncbi:MAG TPA: hypothetical protein VJB60_03085 [Candidatus Peribacterales bacterium]|nr:hypothetical protein [Candidatus Peribacterales bacterium]